MAEPEKTYEYGLTPENTAPGILGLFNVMSGPVVDAFTPERREVITPPKTTYDVGDGYAYPTKTDAVYGAPETKLEYMPFVQGAKGVYDFAGKFFSDGKFRTQTGDALVKGVGQLFSDYYQSGVNLSKTGETSFYDLKEGREVSFNPLIPLEVGLVAGALLPVKAGNSMVAGMFAGRKAATAQPAMFDLAEKMAAKGHSRDEIWDQTGLFRYNDREGKPMGEWKFEIPDDASVAVTDPAALKPYLTETGRVKKGSGQTGYGPEIDKLLVHDELNKAYPGNFSPEKALAEVIRDLSNINEATKKLQVKYGRGELTEPAFRQQYNLLLQQKSELQDLMQKGFPLSAAPGGPAKTVREQYPLLDRPIGDTVMESTTTGAKNLHGYYKPRLNTMAVRRDRGNDFGSRILAFRSTALHELQHAIQQREGFETGGMPKEFGRKENRPVDPETGKRLTPFQTYQRLVGEAEARLVQDRRDMDLEQRRFIPPYSQINESRMYTRKDLGVDRKASGGLVDKPLYNNSRVIG